MSGIRGSCNRPKIAKHLRVSKEKTFTNRTDEDRNRDHLATDAWTERERAKTQEREAVAAEAWRIARADARAARLQSQRVPSE
jgi:hypothetical protein